MNKEDYLKDLIEIKSGNVKAFADSIGMAYTTIRSILDRGIMNAKMENIIKICDGLGIKPEDIVKLESSVVSDTNKIMLQLHPSRQKKVYNYASDQLDEQNNEKISSMFDHKPMIEIPAGRSTAAGSPINGEDQDTQLIHKMIAGEKVPAGADELITVDGDSMEPLLQKGSQVFIHYQPEVENGEIAIVHIRDVGVTCKKFYVNEDNTVTLKSINKAYDDMVFDCDEVNVIGKVIL